MKTKVFRKKILIATFVMAVIISISLVLDRFSKDSLFVFEVSMKHSTKGIAQLFYDLGSGFREPDSYGLHIHKIDSLEIYRFHLPEGRYNSFRLDPINVEGSMTISGVRILGPNGILIKEFPATQFQATNQISSLKKLSEFIQINTVSKANDPTLLMPLDQQLNLNFFSSPVFADFAEFFLLILLIFWSAILFLVAMYIRFSEKINSSWNRYTEWFNNKDPRSQIVYIAIFGVVLSCHPVVFFNQSFVSPNNPTYLLYESIPTVPGYDSTETENVRGADIGAIMWQHLSYSAIQSRAVFEDFELPLWNRFNSGGQTLLGQGQSMFGDPLHFLTLVFGGASWAWDLKFVLAKFLFSVGIGLTVLSATSHLPTSLMLAFSSSFIGFFPYRFNHPAFFSFCYSPWILYFWFQITRSTTAKKSVLGIVGLLLANWSVLSSGTVKEAYMLLVGLNLSGYLVLLCSDVKKYEKGTKSIQVIWAGILFTLISSPIWVTFIEGLSRSFTVYDQPSAVQIHPSLMIGFFDGIFYSQLDPFKRLLFPTVNFLVLIGFLWSIVQIKKCFFNRTYIAIVLGSLIPLALVFKVIPANVIFKIPFLRNVIHIGNTFSVVLIPQVFVLAGFGLKTCWENYNHRKWTTYWLTSILLLGGFLALYFGWNRTVKISGFLGGYGFTLIIAFIMFPYLLKQIRLNSTAERKACLLVCLF